MAPQLNPEKVLPRGDFVAHDSFGSPILRVQVAAVGSLFVLGGMAGAVFAVLSSLIPSSTTLGGVRVSVYLALALGVFS
jgi:hypothetical protein